MAIARKPANAVWRMHRRYNSRLTTDTATLQWLIAAVGARAVARNRIRLADLFGEWEKEYQRHAERERSEMAAWKQTFSVSFRAVKVRVVSQPFTIVLRERS